jgi:hypothetical protein
VRVGPLEQIIESLLETAEPGTYTNEPVVMTAKELAEAGRITGVAGEVPLAQRRDAFVATSGAAGHCSSASSSADVTTL